MKAILSFIIILVIIISIIGIYFWLPPQASTNSQTFKTEPSTKSIELEKLFKDTISCDECGLVQLNH